MSVDLEMIRWPEETAIHPGASVGGQPFGAIDRQEAAVNVDEVLGAAREALTVRRVFADPYEKDGVTVIPAAAVSGGGGGGQGRHQGEDEGTGGGFGMSARPAGVYELSAGRVRWRPAVDVNRLATSAALVAVVFLVTRSRIVRARLKAAGREG